MRNQKTAKQMNKKLRRDDKNFWKKKGKDKPE